jgi:Zn finger protein HypA/HybF involved in hydrogenase expression
MSEAQKTETKAEEEPKPINHRVCTQCNNMFPVPADRYDVKQCPNCHKG